MSKTATDVRAARAKKAYPLWLRLWHGAHALLFLALVVSGLSIHFAETELAVIPFATAIPLHNWTGIAFGVLYVLFVVMNMFGNIKHYTLPRMRSVLRILGWYSYGMFRGKPRPFARSTEKKFNPLQAISYLLVMYALTPACTISGALLLVPSLAPDRVAGAGGVWPMAMIHLATGWGLSLFLIAHLYMITTGPSVGAYLRQMVTGEIDDEISTTHHPMID
jgi:thiosulfate reductase cytochrome b subunit